MPMSLPVYLTVQNTYLNMTINTPVLYSMFPTVYKCNMKHAYVLTLNKPCLDTRSKTCPCLYPCLQPDNAFKYILTTL